MGKTSEWLRLELITLGDILDFVRDATEEERY